MTTKKDKLDNILKQYRSRMFDYYKSEAYLDGIGYPMRWDDEAKQAILSLITEARDASYQAGLKDTIQIISAVAEQNNGTLTVSRESLATIRRNSQLKRYDHPNGDIVFELTKAKDKEN